ncbi:hypothetical protein [Staphylococcus haemolyticus]
MGYQSEYGLEENVLFIDASQSFEKGKNQNHLTTEKFRRNCRKRL